MGFFFSVRRSVIKERMKRLISPANNSMVETDELSGVAAGRVGSITVYVTERGVGGWGALANQAHHFMQRRGKRLPFNSPFETIQWDRTAAAAQPIGRKPSPQLRNATNCRFNQTALICYDFSVQNQHGRKCRARKPRGRPAETSFKTQRIPPIVFPLLSRTLPRGADTFKAATAVQTASCRHSVTPTHPPAL